ncbi:MAG: hypothetical protein IKC71_01115 [Clostridia bacterium]|nr:hypothetical protein [Clostridia bacterium]
MCKKENRFCLYFKDLFSKFSVFLAPFVSALLFTVFYLLNFYGFWDGVTSSPKIFYYFIGVSAFILLFIFSIVSIRIKHNTISFLDVFLLGVGLFLFSYTIFLMATVGFSRWYVYLVLLGATFVVALLIALRIIFYNKVKVPNTVYTITNLKTYLSYTLKKFSSLPIILVSILVIIIFYYIMKHNLFENFIVLKELNKSVYYSIFIVIAIFVLYASIDCSRKKICFLDLFFIGLLLSVPAIWCLLIVFGAHVRNITVCAVLTIFAIFFISIRVLNVDLLFEEKSKTIHKKGNFTLGFKAYYKELFSRYSFMSAVALSVTVVFLIICAKTFGVLDITNPYYSIYIYYTVSGLLMFATLIAFIFTIFTLITCKSYKVLFTDYVLLVLLIISLICVILTIISSSSPLILASVIGFAYCLTLSNTRIRHVKVYDGIEQ